MMSFLWPFLVMKTTHKEFRKLVITLLDQDYGISSSALDQLQIVDDLSFQGVCHDIFRAVNCTEDQCYLSPNHQFTEKL